MTLSPQQQTLVDRLLPIARIATNGTRSGLPLMARCHSLIVGPSGSGKTFIAKEIGSVLGVPVLVINVATWLIIASRAETWTVSIIADWVDRLPGGGLLVLDEIDKLQLDSEWARYVRLEIHDLLDGRFPAATAFPEELPADLQSGAESRLSGLSLRLRDRVMVIGCGAWQSAWHQSSKTVGFNGGNFEFIPQAPTRQQMLQSIDSELRQRFRDEIAVLSPMGRADYEIVAESLEQKIPLQILPAWQEARAAAMARASEGMLGMRAFEELLLEAMVSSGFGSQVQPQNEKLRAPRPPPSIW
jgi:hypothetical protein